MHKSVYFKKARIKYEKEILKYIMEEYFFANLRESFTGDLKGLMCIRNEKK